MIISAIHFHLIHTMRANNEQKKQIYIHTKKIHIERELNTPDQTQSNLHTKRRISILALQAVSI